MAIINANFAIFDGNNLANLVNGLTVLRLDTYKPPKRKLSIMQIARTNKNKTTAAFFNSKPITVTVGISRGTRDAVEQSVDDLMAIIQGLEKELWVPQGGGTRKYITTLSDVNVIKGGGSYWEADLIFACSDNNGMDTAYTGILNDSGITANPRYDQYNFQGSADWQTPYIRITITAISGGTSKTLVVGNPATGQQVSITRTFSVNDVIEVDTSAEFVKVNGVEVAFTGAFPRWAKGVGNIQISHNFTSATMSRLAYYYRRYA